MSVCLPCGLRHEEIKKQAGGDAASFVKGVAERRLCVERRSADGTRKGQDCRRWVFDSDWMPALVETLLRGEMVAFWGQE